AVTPGTRDEHAGTRAMEARDFRVETLAEFQDLLGLPGVVPLVVGPQNCVRCRIDDHGFPRGRAYIHSDQEVLVHGVFSSRQLLWGGPPGPRPTPPSAFSHRGSG